MCSVPPGAWPGPPPSASWTRPRPQPPPRPGRTGAATTWRGSRSANGWKILDEAASHTIEGSGLTVHLANGDAATLLSHVARRFHYEIDQLREKEVTGHTTSREVRRPHESDYLSGTATAIRPHACPLGVRGGPYPQELVVVRDILAELDGAVVWGGDFVSPQESHFEIAWRHPSRSRAPSSIGSEACSSRSQYAQAWVPGP